MTKPCVCAGICFCVVEYHCATPHLVQDNDPFMLGPPIPTMFGNTSILVFKKGNTGIWVLIPVFCSVTLLMS